MVGGSCSRSIPAYRYVIEVGEALSALRYAALVSFIATVIGPLVCGVFGMHLAPKTPEAREKRDYS